MHYYLRGHGKDVALASPHQLRKFVQAALREPDGSTQVSDLGGPAGRARLAELANAAPRFSVTARVGKGPPDRQPVSFQLAVVPLLHLITSPRFCDSTLSALVTPVFATLGTPDMWKALTRCMAAMSTAGRVADAGAVTELDQAWAPATWPELLRPVAAFALKCVSLDRALAASPEFCALVDALPGEQNAWQARAPVAPQVLRIVQDTVRAAGAPVRALREADAVRAAKAEEAAARAARQRLFPPPRNAAAVPPMDGPGELSTLGPRHDNDFEDFRRIRIGPTEQEVLGGRAPFLPPNNLAFAHPAPNAADRLLDTHFRLLRHDLLAPLLESAAALQSIAEPGGIVATLRGNRLRAPKASSDAVDLFAFRNLRVLALQSVSAGMERGTRAGLHYLAEFDQPGRGTRNSREREAYWMASRRLQRGTLVCVWMPPAGAGAPPHLVFATVAQRGDHKSPVALLTHSDKRARLALSPCGPVYNEQLLALAAAQDVRAAPKSECLLLEASDSFFAYEPVLRALQLIDSARLPFQGYLLHTVETAEAPPEMLPPAYVAAYTSFDLSSLARAGTPAAELAELRNVLVADPDLFPVQALLASTSLDERQVDALCAALTSEISLIQGPPGTGKTYVGVQIVRLLLLNCVNRETLEGLEAESSDDEDDGLAGAQPFPRPVRNPPAGKPDIGPILCVCFTNHALDQFLEALLDTGQVSAPGELVRVGGRSKSDRLEEHNLMQLSRAPRVRTHTQGRLLYNAMEMVRNCDAQLEPLLTAAAGGADALRWADLDDLLCTEYPAAWEAFRTEMFATADFQGASRGDVFQRWLRAGPMDGAAAAQSHAAGSAAADSAAVGNRFAQLQLADEQPAAGAATKPKKAVPRPRGAAVGATEAAVPREEVVSRARLDELLHIAVFGRCPLCGAAPEAASDCDCDTAGPECDLWGLLPAERRALAIEWHSRLRSAKTDELAEVVANYEAAQAQLEQAHSDVKLNVLRRARIVGMTTAGAAANQGLLHALGPRVVVVEEAAEVMEAHILAALSARTQHLMLIGDHQQLRPKTNVYSLSVESRKGLDLDISLFERLAAAPEPRPVPVVTLSTQRRMRPSIAELIRRTIYPDLRDADSVHHHPAVRGMRYPLFFLDHDHLEAGEEEEAGALSGSKQNAGEAALVVALTKYLLHQGYAPGQIAVLTPYVGQLKLLRKQLSDVTMVFVDDADEAELQKEADRGSEHSDAESESAKETPPALGVTQLSKRVRLATIDNFQGEEAQVVIVSLVRNNKQGRVGFLATTNRANVLLSRAQHGMYVIGNARTFRESKKGGMWSQVLDVLHADGLVGRSLALVCSNHPDTVTEVSTPAEFATLCGDGGCSRACEFRLSCGHPCGRRCHPDDVQHLSTRCHRPCMRARPCGHPCDEVCSAKCPPCAVQVDVTLSCGHDATVACSQATGDLANVCCKTPVQVVAGTCGHTLTLPCHRSHELEGHPELCTSACGMQLGPCGHACAGICGACRGPFRLPPDSPAHPPCSTVCDRNLMCGHACMAACHAGAQCPPCLAACVVACEHSACNKQCSVACAPCAEPCGWDCPHRGTCPLPCGAPCSRLPCDKRCERVLACGHRCPSLCGETCPGVQYCPQCAHPAHAGDVVDLVMMTSLADHNPDDSPLLLLTCGHAFTMETLDCILELSKFYGVAVGGEWSGTLPLPASFGTRPACPNCRGPLRGLRRYGRLLHHAACQQAEKKFMQASAGRLAAAHRQLTAAVALPAGTAPFAAIGKAVKAMQAEVRACGEPPTVKLHRACLATLQRASLPADDLPVPAPDAQSLCKAHLGLAQALSESMAAAAAEMCVPPSTGAGAGRGRGRGAAPARGRGAASSPAPATLDTLRASGDRAIAAYEQALQLARERQLKQSAGRTLAQLSQHLARCVVERVRVRDRATAERGGVPLTAADEARLKQLLDRAAETAKSAIDGAPGEYENSAPDLVTMARAVLASLPQLRESLAGLSDAEARMVFQTIGFQDGGFTGAGHWFACPNGHTYVIADCGGAVTESICPECGARIGGSGHNLRTDNARADAFLRQAGGRL